MLVSVTLRLLCSLQQECETCYELSYDAARFGCAWLDITCEFLRVTSEHPSKFDDAYHKCIYMKCYIEYHGPQGDF